MLEDMHEGLVSAFTISTTLNMWMRSQMLKRDFANGVKHNIKTNLEEKGIQRTASCDKYNNQIINERTFLKLYIIPLKSHSIHFLLKNNYDAERTITYGRDAGQV